MTLQIRGISKTYPNGVQALKDVALTIPKGMYGLLGPNGAGKSTLMKVLSGLIRPVAGAISLDGKDLAALSAPQVARAGLIAPDQATFDWLEADDRDSFRRKPV